MDIEQYIRKKYEGYVTVSTSYVFYELHLVDNTQNRKNIRELLELPRCPNTLDVDTFAALIAAMI